MKNSLSTTARALAPLALLLLAAASGCSDDGGSDDSAADAAPAADAAGADAVPGAAACYPTGIYGKCSETGCTNCLNGANIYSVCSSSCSVNADCGGANEFNGASPLCAPLNPNDTVNKICVLTCTAAEQCPCGLECRASGVSGVNICAETL